MIPMFKVFMAKEAEVAVAEVLRSGYVGQGPKVDQFEAQLRGYLTAPWDVLTVNSCTSALELALHLAGVSPGDEVITTAQTCTATNGAIVRAGAIPVWADIDPITGLIDPKSVEQCITSDTAAIMAVDWAGSPCDYDAIRSFNIPVIEDAAHAFGSEYKGVDTSVSGGDYVCYSFQAIKHLTTGDGGLLKTPEKQVDRARLLRWYGLDRRSKASFRCQQDIQEVGFKMHMNDIAAAIGIANLRYVHTVIRNQCRNYSLYYENLKNVKGIHIPERDVAGSNLWLCTLIVDDRDRFEAWAKERGVFDTSQVHARNDKHTAFSRIAKKPVPLTGLEYFSQHQVSIPMHWDVSVDDTNRIVEEIREFSKQVYG